MSGEMEELIQKLAELTELAFEDVESELSALVDNIKSETEKGSTYKVEGLGTFRKLGEELTFTPDEKLATEINYKYAGMEPIEIMAGFAEQEVDEDQKVQQEPSERSRRMEEEVEETISSEEVEKDEQVAETEDQELVSESEQTEEVTPKAEISSEKKDDAKSTAKEKPVEADLPEEKPSKEPATLNESKTEKKEPIPEKEEKSLAVSSSTTKSKEQSQKKTKKKTKKKSKTPSQRDNQTTTWVILSAAAVVILAVVIWGLSQPNGGTQENEQMTSGTPSTAQQKESGSDDDKSTVDKQSTQKSSADRQSESSKPVTSVASDPEDLPDSPALNMDYDADYGLKGIPSNKGMNGYTLVVYSFGRESNATRQADALSEKGYRAVVDYVTLNDSTERWRVGVGQFETISDAQNASDKLPEPFRSDFFIKRIN